MRPENLDGLAERRGRLKRLGIDHGVPGVHPAHMGNAAPVPEAFAAKHLKSLQA